MTDLQLLYVLIILDRYPIAYDLIQEEYLDVVDEKCLYNRENGVLTDEGRRTLCRLADEGDYEETETRLKDIL